MPQKLNWLSRLNRIIEKEGKGLKLSNEGMANKMATSERDLFRKIKSYSGLSPQKYLRRYRLKKAKLFLETGKYRTVKETAEAVGYSKVSYFIKQFELEFGKKPLQILKDNGWR